MKQDYPRAPYLTEVVTGYHGTSRQAARQILDTQQFQISESKFEWLGDGAYFFQSSIHRARQWAEENHDEPAVVCADIELGHCIDLLDNRWVPPIRVAEQNLQESAEAADERPPYNKGKMHLLDNKVINRLAEIWRPQTVRAAFAEGHAMMPGDAFGDALHIQIGVRSPDEVIRNIRFDGDWP